MAFLETWEPLRNNIAVLWLKPEAIDIVKVETRGNWYFYRTVSRDYKIFFSTKIGKRTFKKCPKFSLSPDRAEILFNCLWLQPKAIGKIAAKAGTSPKKGLLCCSQKRKSVAIQTTPSYKQLNLEKNYTATFAFAICVSACTCAAFARPLGSWFSCHFGIHFRTV